MEPQTHITGRSRHICSISAAQHDRKDRNDILRRQRTNRAVYSGSHRAPAPFHANTPVAFVGGALESHVNNACHGALLQVNLVNVRLLGVGRERLVLRDISNKFGSKRCLRDPAEWFARSTAPIDGIPRQEMCACKKNKQREAGAGAGVRGVRHKGRGGGGYS